MFGRQVIFRGTSRGAESQATVPGNWERLIRIEAENAANLAITAGKCSPILIFIRKAANSRTGRRRCDHRGSVACAGGNLVGALS